MNIKSIIVDDQNIAIKRIEKLLNGHETIEIIGSFSNGLEAVDYINYLKPDVVFLDIKIQEVSGFDIIDKISTDFKPLFIFITKHNEFAYKAFDYFAFDYIIKPYEETRFYQTIDKIVKYKRKEELISLQSSLNNILSIVQNKETTGNRKINIKSGNKIFFLNLDTIKYISASGYYVEIFTDDNKRHLLRESLSSIIRRLNSSRFIRIHRSTIINTDFIEEIITSSYGETDVKIMDLKPTFRVSKGYKKEFQELMGVK